MSAAYFTPHMTSAVHIPLPLRHPLASALWLALTLPMAAQAQETTQDPHRQDQHQLDSVVVTASPLHQTAEELVRPVEVLAGAINSHPELQRGKILFICGNYSRILSRLNRNII